MAIFNEAYGYKLDAEINNGYLKCNVFKKTIEVDLPPDLKDSILVLSELNKVSKDKKMINLLLKLEKNLKKLVSENHHWSGSLTNFMAISKTIQFDLNKIVVELKNLQIGLSTIQFDKEEINEKRLIHSDVKEEYEKYKSKNSTFEASVLLKKSVINKAIDSIIKFIEKIEKETDKFFKNVEKTYKILKETYAESNIINNLEEAALVAVLSEICLKNPNRTSIRNLADIINTMNVCKKKDVYYVCAGIFVFFMFFAKLYYSIDETKIMMALKYIKSI